MNVGCLGNIKDLLLNRFSGDISFCELHTLP